jgi:FAD/FMN-containing dehydrogenase
VERTFAQPLLDFRDEVGATDRVCAVGGRTQWDIGRAAGAAADDDQAQDVREVRPPVGIVSIDPAEMLTRVRAGTSIVELNDALAAVGQFVALPLPTRPFAEPDSSAAATVGGALAIGYSSSLRLGHGPIRDTVLEATWVTGHGELVVAGGPVVKNVTGYDLCRVLVGSRGRLGLMSEVVLRTRPRPLARQWFSSHWTPTRLATTLWRPTAIWWDAVLCWVCLEGHHDDIAEQAALASLSACDEPPVVPGAYRWSLAAHQVEAWCGALEPGSFIAEMGVGIVHSSTNRADHPNASMMALSEPVRRVHDSLLRAFDPGGRMNPLVGW